jgi:uncharacterized membrane protein YkvA (DUF1232 family)
MKILTRITNLFTTPYSFYLLLRDPQFPWKSKLKAGLIVAAMAFYILNPADLVPDLIPFWGLIDDLAVIPLLMAVSEFVVPEIKVAEIRSRAHSGARKVVFWTVAGVLAAVITALSILGMLIYLAVRLWT